MGGTPDMVFVIDPNKEDLAILEAKKLGIPVIAVLNSNSSPDGIDYPIPGNDDAARAIALYCDLIARAALDGMAAPMLVSPTLHRSCANRKWHSHKGRSHARCSADRSASGNGRSPAGPAPASGTTCPPGPPDVARPRRRHLARAGKLFQIGHVQAARNVPARRPAEPAATHRAGETVLDTRLTHGRNGLPGKLGVRCSSRRTGTPLTKTCFMPRAGHCRPSS